MDKLLLAIFLCLFVIAIATAIPTNNPDFQERFRGKLLPTIRKAWIDMFKMLTDAGASFRHLFRPMATTRKPIVVTTIEEYDF